MESRFEFKLIGTPKKSTTASPVLPHSPQVKKVTIEDAHPYDYPTQIRQATPMDNNITIYLGDLHANWVLLTMQLIKFGFIEQDKETFDKLCEIHASVQPILIESYIEKEITGDSSECVSERKKKLEIAKELYSEDLEAIRDIFRKQTKIINKELRLSLAGDETADREGNDLYFMEMVEALVDGGLQLDKILLSNHGIDFLYALKFNDCARYTSQRHHYPFDTISVNAGSFNYSLQNLGKFIEWGIVTKERVTRFLDKYYIPKLALLDIIRDKNKKDAIAIVTHASMWPTKKDSSLFLDEFFEKFDIRYDMKVPQPKELNHLASQINNMFRTMLMDKEWYECLIDAFGDDDDILRKLIWNREKATPVKLDTSFNYTMVNGHDSTLHEKDLSEELAEIYICIDHDGGKSRMQGDYGRHAIHSVEITSSQTPEKKLENNEVEKRRGIMADIFPPTRGLEVSGRGLLDNPASALPVPQFSLDDPDDVLISERPGHA